MMRIKIRQTGKRQHKEKIRQKEEIKWEKENNATYDEWRVPAVANVDWWNKSGDWRKDQIARIVEYQVIWL